MYKMQEIVKSGTLRPGAWSEEEDQILLGLIQRRYKKWGHIADTINRDYYNNMKIRSGKQCKERWNNHLNPEINRSPWSIKEELILLKQHRKIGNKWSLIALKLNNRTESSIKNKIKSLLNKGYMELYSVNS